MRVPFLLVEPKLRHYLADVSGPLAWVVLPRSGDVARALNQTGVGFSSAYFMRKLLSAAQSGALAADSYFGLGATGFTRAAPYLRCMSASAYLASLSIVLRAGLSVEELASSLLERGFGGGADLVNIRYKQRVLMRRLRFVLFTLCGNVPHLLNKHRLVQLAAQVGRGYLLQRHTFAVRALLRCCKLVLRREEVAYMLHGGYIFVNGLACLSPSYQLGPGDCLQMVLNKTFVLYLLRGWQSLYRTYVRVLAPRGANARPRRGLSRHLFAFDDVPLGLEVDYLTLTVFCLPARVPPYEGSWTLSYYLTWNNASAYLWRYSY